MSRLSHMPFFVDDYEAATPHLSLEEDGAYNRLLRLCWRQNDCSIPDDDAWIMRMVRCDSQTFERVIRPVIEEFFARLNGRLFQKRQKREHGYIKKTVSNRKLAGRKGGLSKSLKQKENKASNTTVLLEQKPSNTLAPIPIPIPIPIKDQEDARARAAPGISGDPVFDAVMAATNGKIGTSPRLLDTSPISRLVADGYSLETVILPKIRSLAAATHKGWASWDYVAKVVRTDCPSPFAPNGHDFELWEKRLATARKLKQWDAKWGPQPGSPFCRIPADILLAGDGVGWTDWKQTG